MNTIGSPPASEVGKPDETPELEKSEGSCVGASEASAIERGGSDKASPNQTNKHGNEHEIEGASMSLQDEVELHRIEDYVDLDLDTLSYKLEEQHQVLKRELVAFFVETKGKLRAKGCEELGLLRSKFERGLAAKQEEVLILEKDLAASRRNVKSLYSTLSLFADALANANDNKRIGRTVVICFQRWKSFAAQERRLKAHLRKALQWYDLQYMKHRVMVYWRDWVRCAQRQTYKERLQKHIQVAQEKIESEYKAKFDAVEKENAKLKSCLEKEAQARDLMEEDMKQAFMRGLCALNLEALTIMKRGVPPGANPFPLTYPIGKEDVMKSVLSQQSGEQTEDKSSVQFLGA